MKASVIATLLVCFVSAANAESIGYELYKLSGKEGRSLVAKGTKEYTLRDIAVEEIKFRDSHWWSKELPIVNGFSAGASIYREKDLTGFGLWLKEHSSWWGRLSGGGFSWDWFDRESGSIYRKLQGAGRVRVTLAPSQQYQEIAAIEFLEDVTLRVKLKPWFLYFLSDEDTHHLVIIKGSVLRFAP
jgi:hypothetical protein